LFGRREREGRTLEGMGRKGNIGESLPFFEGVMEILMTYE